MNGAMHLWVVQWIKVHVHHQNQAILNCNALKRKATLVQVDVPQTVSINV